MVIDEDFSFGDYRNYKHVSEGTRMLRQNVRRLAEQWSSFDSVEDLQEIDPYYIAYERDIRGGKPQRITIVIRTVGSNYEIELPSGSIIGMGAERKAQAVIRNSRGNRWLFEYFLNQYED